jgi:NAD(P)H-dependent FMN reductase
VPDLYTYSYAIIRLVPRVEREEFLNVGVIVSCPAKGFLEARIALDAQRVRAFAATIDIASLQKHLDAILTICAGGKQAGPIGQLSQRERFYWLSAPRSTIIQVSPVHTGLCQDPATTLQHLLETMVQPLHPQSAAIAKVERDEHVVRLLAISGSLRAESSNSILLRAAAKLAPQDVIVELYEKLGELPHFNPDIEEGAPPVVKDFGAQIGAADGIIISTPEYAHGMPGVLKNALDWLVGGFDFINKPVALFNASPRSTYAIASLTEVVTIMSGRIVADACISVPLRELHLDEAGLLSHREIAPVIQNALTTFAAAIRRDREQSSG